MGVASRGWRAASTLASLRMLAGGLPGLKTMEVLSMFRYCDLDIGVAAYEAVPDMMVEVTVAVLVEINITESELWYWYLHGEGRRCWFDGEEG